MVPFHDFVGVNIAPVSKKTAVKTVVGIIQIFILPIFKSLEIQISIFFIVNSYSIEEETASHQQVPVHALGDLKDPTATLSSVL